MANEQNLRPSVYKFTQEDHKKAVEARREKKKLRECLSYLLEKEDPLTLGEDGQPMTGAEKLSVNLFLRALTEEDTGKAARAFEVLRDTAGQKPVERIVMAEVDASVIEEVERMVYDTK